MMKKLNFKILMFALAMVFSFNTYANDANPFKISIVKAIAAKKLLLNLQDMRASKVSCTISNESGHVVYNGKIIIDEEKSINKRYDLSRLEKGMYTLMIDDLMKVEKLTFEVTENDIVFNNNQSEIIYKPTVWINADKTVDFNLLSFGEKVTVEVVKDLDVIHTEIFRGEMTSSRVFNFGKLEEGVYTMVISYKGEYFYKYITV